MIKTRKIFQQSCYSSNSSEPLFSIPLLRPPPPRGSQCQPPHSPFREQPCLRELPRTLLPPCPRQRTWHRLSTFSASPTAFSKFIYQHEHQHHLLDCDQPTSGRMPAWRTSGQTC